MLNGVVPSSKHSGKQKQSKPMTQPFSVATAEMRARHQTSLLLL